MFVGPAPKSKSERAENKKSSDMNEQLLNLCKTIAISLQREESSETSTDSEVGSNTQDNPYCPYCGKTMFSSQTDDADWSCKNCGFKAYDQDL